MAEDLLSSALALAVKKLGGASREMKGRPVPGWVEVSARTTSGAVRGETPSSI